VAEKRQAAKDLEHSLLLLAGQPYGAGGGGAVPDGEKIRKMATSPKLKGHKIRSWGAKANAILLVVSLVLSVTAAFAAGEIYIRLTKPYETPDTWRK